MFERTVRAEQYFANQQPTARAIAEETSVKDGGREENLSRPL